MATRQTRIKATREWIKIRSPTVLFLHTGSLTFDGQLLLVTMRFSTSILVLAAPSIVLAKPTKASGSLSYINVPDPDHSSSWSEKRKLCQSKWEEASKRLGLKVETCSKYSKSKSAALWNCS